MMWVDARGRLNVPKVTACFDETTKVPARSETSRPLALSTVKFLKTAGGGDLPPALLKEARVFSRVRRSNAN